MGLASHERSVPSSSPHRPPPGPRVLLRRLVIACPVTGLATDTGFDLSAVPALGGGEHLLVDCLECGQDHSWQIDDAFLD